MKILTALIFTVLFIGSVFAQKQAEVTVMSTHLRKLPTMDSEKVYTAQKGEKVTLEKKRDSNGWYFVTAANGTIKGWIRQDTISFTLSKQKVEEKIETATVEKQPITTPSSNNNSSTAAPIATPPPTEDSTPIEDNEVLQIDTQEVSLNVRVVDANNRPVNKLDQTQFKVYEDDVLQPITSLTTTEVPMINALVIDNSRSLRTQLGKIIEAGKIIVGANHQNDESTIVRFISSNKIEVIQDFTASKKSLNNALDNLFVEGGQTAIIDAVYQTAKKVEQHQNSGKKEDIKRRALILVSDGDDRSSIYQEEQLFKLLRDSNVQIYAIGFIGELSQKPEANSVSRQEKARSFLTRLAEETGGKVYFPESLDKLPQIASDISGELRTQYLISYSPTNETRDGTFRKIKVEITDGEGNTKRIAITRTGRNSLPQQ
jgi:Ca-activated chloride channel homolog